MSADWKILPVVLACLLGMLCVPYSAVAMGPAVQLANQNSTVNIVTNSQAGMNNWTIDDDNVLNQQWFWFRVGSSGGQSSLDTLPATYTYISPSEVQASFTGSTFVVTLTFTLTGEPSGSGNADLAQVFSIKNTSERNITFHFYEYCNFVLGGNAADTVIFPSANTVSQTSSSGSIIENAFATGLPGYIAPTYYEANVYSNTLASLNSGSPYVLNNANKAGPGNVTWAFQWDAVNLQPSQGVGISKDIDVMIPEPSTLTLAAAGLAGLWLLRRRNR